MSLALLWSCLSSRNIIINGPSESSLLLASGVQISTVILLLKRSRIQRISYEIRHAECCLTALFWLQSY